MQKPDEIEELIAEKIQRLKYWKERDKMDAEDKAVEGNKKKKKELLERRKKEAAAKKLEEDAKEDGTWV